ncbi:MAG: hypothetical protein AB7O66_02400 [Limisphaerales bacterium]
MRNRRSLEFTAGVCAFGTAVVAYVAVTDFPPSYDRAFHRSVGQAIARETLRHSNTGGAITAIVRDTAEFRHPEADAQFDGFEAAITAGGAVIEKIQGLQIDPLRPIAVPPGDFFELIRRAPQGSVIVSFMGPPELTPEQRALLPETKPAIIAFCPGNLPGRANLPELFQAGLLRAAIVDRPPPAAKPSGGAPPARPRVFEDAYRIVHAADASGLPEDGSDSRASLDVP